jgi:hypothetical protein
MHAHTPDVTTVATVYDRVGIRREVVTYEISVGGRKFVLFFASAITSAATNTESAIKEQRSLSGRFLGAHLFTFTGTSQDVENCNYCAFDGSNK